MKRSDLLKAVNSIEEEAYSEENLSSVDEDAKDFEGASKKAKSRIVNGIDTLRYTIYLTPVEREVISLLSYEKNMQKSEIARELLDLGIEKGYPGYEEKAKENIAKRHGNEQF